MENIISDIYQTNILSLDINNDLQKIAEIMIKTIELAKEEKYLYNNGKLWKIIYEDDKIYKLQLCKRLFKRTVNSNLIFSNFKNKIYYTKFYKHFYSPKNYSKLAFDTKETFIFEDYKFNYIIKEKVYNNKNHILEDFLKSSSEFKKDLLIENYIKIANNIRRVYHLYDSSIYNDCYKPYLYLYSNEFKNIIDHYNTKPLVNFNHFKDVKSIANTFSLPKFVPMIIIFDSYHEINFNDNTKLTIEQIKKIRELEKDLVDNPLRKGKNFTNHEYYQSVLITQITNKNKQSYINGLLLIFSKPRALALLNKLTKY